MTTYLLSIYQPDGDPPPPEVLGPIMAATAAVRSDMIDAGVWLSSVGLLPASAATVVRVAGGAPVLTDGPYVEAKEHLGGFTLVDVADLDAALAWAERLAGATTLPIEVRPVAFS